MYNRIEIEFNHNIFKAFWRYVRPKMINDYDRLIFVANTKEQAEQRAKDFRSGTGEFSIPHPDIAEELVYL